MQTPKSNRSNKYLQRPHFIFWLTDLAFRISSQELQLEYLQLTVPQQREPLGLNWASSANAWQGPNAELVTFSRCWIKALCDLNHHSEARFCRWIIKIVWVICRKLQVEDGWSDYTQSLSVSLVSLVLVESRQDFSKPGHLFPLCARPGGVLGPPRFGAWKTPGRHDWPQMFCSWLMCQWSWFSPLTTVQPICCQDIRNPLSISAASLAWHLSVFWQSWSYPQSKKRNVPKYVNEANKTASFTTSHVTCDLMSHVDSCDLQSSFLFEIWSKHTDCRCMMMARCTAGMIAWSLRELIVFRSLETQRPQFLQLWNGSKHSSDCLRFSMLRWLCSRSSSTDNKMDCVPPHQSLR